VSLHGSLAALDEVRATRSRIGKEIALGALLRVAASDARGLAVVARIAAGGALPVGDGRSLGVGGSLAFEVACAATHFSSEIVYACARACGDLGEAFGLLVARDDAASVREGVALTEVADLFEALATTGTRATKRRLLDEAFARATPLETKYLMKGLLGSLRIGAQGGVLEGAIARAFERDPEEVRRAAALVVDPGELAVLAHDGRLAEARLSIGRPVSFMLATPIETIPTRPDLALHVIEDKIDGVRAQVHKRGDAVSIFARGLDRMERAFPEIEEAFGVARGDVALDGEIVVMGEGGRPRPFQTLQARLRKTAPSAGEMAESPVAFIAYDILAEGDDDLLALPWTERRARLESYAEERGPSAAFVVNPFKDGARADLDAEFDAARARGYEGLLLKRKDAPYDAGRRGQAWIKVKRAYATLDVVVTAAEEGHGRRAGVLSDYTFGVWSEGEIVNVGKAYSGLTDDEIDQMTKRLDAITIARRGGLRAVKPEIVLEVGFDGVQPSTRHKSGFALRFPRIVRIRDDKRPEDADKLDAVVAMHRAQIESGHREEAVAPKPKAANAPRTKKRGKAATNDRQLDLFGGADDRLPRKNG
jgi:DNA ligase-1